MPKKSEELSKSIPTVQLIAITFALFFFGSFFLLTAPQAVELVESSVLSASNQVWEKPKYLTVERTPSEQKIGIELLESKITPPIFSAQAVLAQDWDSGKILFQKNIHRRLAPASTTKIMTALVAQDYFRPADVLIVPESAMVGGSTMGLAVGEQLSFRSLLYGMLLNSGNDAAYVIAHNYPDGYWAFMEKMNQKVKELGLNDTHFENPAGFDNPNHYSSAHDLAKIAQAAVLSPQIARIVATRETSVLSWDKSNYHELRNLNKLLVEDGVIGIKTGYTELAGENFIGLIERVDATTGSTAKSDKKRKVITVVLSSQDRFGETKKLMDWVYSNYDWQETVISSR